MRIPDMDCTFKTKWIVDQYKKQKKDYEKERDTCYEENKCLEKKKVNDNDECILCQLKADNVSAIDKYDPKNNKTMENFEALQPLYTYIPVMAELANVKTKEDVKTVLNNVSSPVGAWSMKEKKNVSAIGALVGGQISYEFTVDAPDGNAMGIFAPVGLDFTTNIIPQSYRNTRDTSWLTKLSNGFTNWYTNTFGSWGVFTSVIDLGNFASARYTNDDQMDTKSDIGWPQVISLGVFPHVNIKKSPIVLGAGVSYAPQLRAIKTDTGDTVNRGCIRIMAFIAVDVTLLPF